MCVGKPKALAGTANFLCTLVRKFERIEARDEREWEGKVMITAKNVNGCLIGRYLRSKGCCLILYGFNSTVLLSGDRKLVLVFQPYLESHNILARRATGNKRIESMMGVLEMIGNR